MTDVSTHVATAEGLDEDQAKLNEELAHFSEIKEKLLKDGRYKEKFVAMKDCKIVGVGENKFSLARKVMAAYPAAVILVRKVTAKKQVVDLPSVEVIQ